MRVAVTGGTGVVGRAVVRHLCESGSDVVALARSDRGAVALATMGATPVIGDLTEPESLGPLVSGSQWVFNVAGVNELCSRDPERMWQVNVNGALAVLEACEMAGVQRLVHTSSAVTLGAPGDVVATETTKHRGWFVSEYERSKTVAERLLFDQASSVEVVSVNPSSVQGPGRLSGTGRLLLTAARGTATLAVDAIFSIVDIDDSAAGHLLAAESGVPGERYVLSGAVTSVRALIREMNTITGQKTRPYFVSPDRLESIVRFLEPVGRRLRDVPLCVESVRVLSDGHVYDGNRASRELGLRYRSLTETLQRTAEWFRTENLL